MTYEKTLTSGAIGHILEGHDVKEPILQILAYKNVTTDSTKRYRFLLSDGIYTHQCCIMMGDMINKLEQGEFERYTIVRMEKYVCNNIQGKKVIIMVQPVVVVAGATVAKKIGNPVPYGSAQAPTLSSVQQCAPDENFSSNSNQFVPGNEPKRMKTDYRYSTGKKDSLQNTGQLNASLACPIATITPYQNKWIIKGRVIGKSGIRHWSNARGEGKLFSFDMKDESAEIRITAFKAECDKFYDMIEIDKIFLVSRGQIKAANKQYSQIANDYEISLTSDSIIESAEEDESCPQITFNFIPIADIASTPADAFIDIAGICRNPGEVQTLTQKSTMKELKKRDIILVDQSQAEIKLTLWGEEATNFKATDDNVIVVRKARVTDFNGKSLTSGGSTVLQIDPQIDVVYGLKGWYNRVKSDLVTNNLSTGASAGSSAPWNQLNSITKENVSINNDFQMSTKATIIQTDHTKEAWVTLFHDEAEKLLGINIDELGKIKENNQEEFDEVISSICFKSYTFKLRSKIDHYKEESRVRTVASSVAPVNFAEYGKKLISLIKEQ